MRIVIDMQGVQSESRSEGAAQYSLQFVKHLLAESVDHECILLMSNQYPANIDELWHSDQERAPRIKTVFWSAPGPLCATHTANGHRIAAAELIREACIASLHPDVLIITSLFGEPGDNVVTTITAGNKYKTATLYYDAVPLIPDEELQEMEYGNNWHASRLERLKNSDAILTASEWARREAIDALGTQSQHRVINISASARSIFKKREILPDATQAILQKYRIFRPFILHVGNLEPRTNTKSLVNAYNKLPEILKHQYQLVIVNQFREEEPRYSNIELDLNADNVTTLFSVNNDDLSTLYNLCKLVVNPSWQEGFCLSALEAMQCGAPVVGSHTSSTQEIIGLDRAFFDPHSVASISAKIEEALTDCDFRSQLIQNAVSRSKLFSWQETARSALTAIEQLYHAPLDAAGTTPASEKRKRLAFVSPLPPERTGIADYASELLPALARHYDIDVIIHQKEVSDAWVSENLEIKTSEWFRANSGRYDRVLYQFGNSPFHQHMFDLIECIPGVLILHDFFLSHLHAHMELHGGLHDSWTRRLSESHGYSAVSKRHKESDHLSTVTAYPCNLDILTAALGVIVHSDHSKQLADKFYGSALSMTWHKMPFLRAIPSLKDRNDARDDLGINTGELIVCSFGILGPTKLNHRLLQAWLKSEMAEDPRCRLIFVGELASTSFATELREKIRNSGKKDRIEITGWAERSKYFDYLAAADIAVQLRTDSRGETSAAVFDCMAAGLPTIVNENGSMAELDPGSVLRIGDEFDDADLISALNRLKRDVELRSDIGRQAKAVIAAEHSADACASICVEAIEMSYSAELNATAIAHQNLLKFLAPIVSGAGPDIDLTELSKSIALTFPDTQRPSRLYVDVTETRRSGRKTGIERVVSSLCRAMIERPTKDYVLMPVYLCNENGEHKYRHARAWTLEILQSTGAEYLSDTPVDFSSQDALLIADISGSSLVNSAAGGLYDEIRKAGVHITALVFDLLPISHPEFFPPGTSWFEEWLMTVCRISDQLVCISNDVAKALTEWVAKHRNKIPRFPLIDWFQLGADLPNVSSNPWSRTLPVPLVDPTFLMVGTIEPRKGHRQALDAFEQLWKSGVEANLVILGREGWIGLPNSFRRSIPEITRRLTSHSYLNQRLFWVKDASDETLEQFYQSSTCLLATSEGEGFGLPLIEAAQHKLPIIARNIPVFREVAGDCAFYFDGLSGDDLARSVRCWISLKEQSRHPISDNLQWKTWEESALQLSSLIGQARAARASDSSISALNAA